MKDIVNFGGKENIKIDYKLIMKTQMKIGGKQRTEN